MSFYCDYCGDETDKPKEDGQGHYFCTWSCCKTFHKAMKKKI